MVCHFNPPTSPPLPAGDGNVSFVKRRKALHLFTFVILCPGDALREEVLGGSQEYVAHWASGGWSHRDAHRTMRALSSPTSPTLHLTGP